MTDRPASVVPDPLKADCGLSNLEVALLETWAIAAKVTEITTIRRLSPEAYDLTIEGQHEQFAGLGQVSFTAWLPLACISAMTDWTRPALARLTDYPVMTMSGDWSGVRDTRRPAQWTIFRHFVQEPWLEALVEAEITRRVAEAFARRGAAR